MMPSSGGVTAEPIGGSREVVQAKPARSIDTRKEYGLREPHLAILPSAEVNICRIWANDAAVRSPSARFQFIAGGSFGRTIERPGKCAG
jgi:hypothetical protein